MKRIFAYLLFICCNTTVVSGQIHINKDLTKHVPPNSAADISITAIKLEKYVPGNSLVSTATGQIYQIDSSVASIADILGNQNPPPKKDTPQNFSCTITIHNGNDNDANETFLVALLPVEVVVISLPLNAMQHKSATAPFYPGYIIFDLGQVKRGQNISVSFAFMRSKFANKLSAYTYCLTPDGNPANNYKDVSW